MDVGSLRAELELDTTQFRRDIDQAGNQFRQLGQGAETSFRGIMDAQGRLRDEQGRYIREVRDGSDAVNRAGQQQETALRGIRDANGRLRDEHGRYIREVREGANTAERAGERVGRSFREAGREADRSGSIFDGLGDRISGAMERGAGAAEGAGATGGGSFIAAFGTRIAALGSKAGPIGLALGATVGVGALFGAKLADTVYDGFQIQAERDFSQAQFGFTDTQMDVAGEAAGAAFGNAFGESVNANIGTAGMAIQSGLIDGDATAAEMQPLIEQLTFVSQIMGEEIPAVAKSAGQWIKTGLVDTPTEAFDLLTAAQQRGLNRSEDLLDTMNEYGVQFQKLGIDGPAAFGLIAQASKGGVRDTDLAADALKEFSLRVIDTGEETTEILNGLGETMGLTAQEMQTELGKGGEAAFNMSDKIIDALGDIENPIERNAAGVALFGTQWEDMGAAINNLDLSTARDELNSSGKAAEGMGIAGGGAASAMEAARNRISVAADETKLKLAEAFAPTALDAATWIGEHQDEIVLFLAQTAAAAIDVTVALIDGAGAMLQFGSMAYNAGLDILDGFVGPLLTMMDSLGGMAKHIPGLGWLGDALEGTATKTRGVIDGMKAGADGMDRAGGAMFTLADKIRDGSATLDDFIAAQQASMTETEALESKVTALGDTLNTLPRDKPISITAPGGTGVKDLLTELGVKVNTDNNKNVVVESPLAPGVIATLEQLGIKVRTDNNKSILVTSTAPGVKVDIDNLKTAIDNLPQQRAIDVITNFATTGTPPPRTGTNSQAADGVLGAFPNADGPPRAGGGPIRGFGGPKQDNILTPTSNGEWVIQAAAVDKYGEEFMAMLNAGMLGEPRADGGPVGPAAVRSAISGLAGAEYVFGGWDGTWNTDCSGAQAKAANWATTGDTEAGGRFATGNMAEALAARGYQPGQAPAGVPAIEHGWYNGGEGGGHAAGLIQDPVGGNTPFEMGGQSGGGAVGAGASSSRDIGATDYAWLPLGSEDPNATGSGSLGSQSQIPGTSTPGVYGINGGEGSAQNVYVVGGRLDGSVSTSSGSTTAPSDTTGPEVFGKGPLPIVAYATGGIDAKPASATMLNGERTWLTMAGEAGVEAYIPINGSDRSKELWKETGRRLGLTEAFAAGGFGGYSDDMTDAMKPQNWYDWASLAVGGTMTAASMVMPYVNMATSGKVDLGSMTPNINTGANSIDVTGMISEALTPIQKQLEELTTAVVHSGKTLHMVDRGTGAADMLGMKVGR